MINNRFEICINMLHLNFQNEEVPGYTKNINNQWLYSQAAVDVVHEYTMKFPKLFQLMNKQSNAMSDPIFESELGVSQEVSISDYLLLFEIMRDIKLTDVH